MATILPFDEINALMGEKVEEISINYGNSDKKKKTEEICEYLLSILIFAYRFGISQVSEALGVDVEDDIDEMYEIIFCRIGGETFEDRVRKHVEDDADGMLRVLAESEAHRVSESAAWHGADRAAKAYDIGVGKKWQTMQDDRVRETHEYLQGDVVGLHEEFYTFDGDHALFPGGFQNAANNVNCRCGLQYVNLNNSGAVPVIGQGRP